MYFFALLTILRNLFLEVFDLTLISFTVLSLELLKLFIED